MATIGLPLTTGALPYSCYPSDPQTFYADMFSRARALFPEIKGVLISATTPSAADRDKLWIKTSGGAPIQPQPQFIYYNGLWVWPNSVVAGGNKRELWVGTLADLVTYDGGDANPVGDASGPMWEEDTRFQGRSPMGVGAINGSDPAKSLTVNEQYGEGSVKLTSAQAFAMQSHKHVIGRKRNLNKDTWLTVIGDTEQPYNGASSLLAGPVSNDAESQSNQALSTASGEYAITSEPYNAETGELISPDSNESHQNTHPVVGVYIIKRTSRVYYKG